MKNLILFLTLLFLKCSPIICDCKNHKTCSDCIQYDNAGCVWCSADGVEDRCTSKTNPDIKTWCKDIEIHGPKNDKKESQDVEFSGKRDRVVQIKPQYLKYTVSSGVTIQIQMFYKPAQDAPLDVYYLTDSTKSMNNYLELIKAQGLTIFTKLSELTNNIRIGIGSFMEKPAAPFGDQADGTVFNNIVSLTDNEKTLKDTLKTLKVETVNNEDQEPTLDALMQVMVCKERVGWRDDARRIIVVFTNAQYHFATEGKGMAAMKRNDRKCHDSNNDVDFDYTSLSQVINVAKTNSFVIIFVVPEEVADDYKMIANEIYGAKCVIFNRKKELRKDIADVILDEYTKIVKDTRIITHRSSPNIAVNLQSNCTDCRAWHFQTIATTATFNVLSCPEPSTRKEYIKIGPKSLNEALTVEFEYDCMCDCEKNDAKVINSTKCTNSGTHQCGICKCDPNSYGDNCSCKGGLSDLHKCKQEDDEFPCSGRGKCVCGICECSEGFHGDFCQFDDNSCPKPGGLLCNGIGKCRFGECHCPAGWSPPDCKCPNDPEINCFAPYSNQLCSGNGKCVCGKCECDIIKGSNETYSGLFCDSSVQFSMRRCEELKDYAYCNFLKRNDCNTLLLSNVTKINVNFEDKSEMDDPSREWYTGKWCPRTLDDGSVLIFKYYDSPSAPDTLFLVIQKQLIPKADIWVTIGSTIGGIILVGIVTILLWKILVDVRDQREYEQFLIKARAAGYDALNPLYEDPIVQFSNLMHQES